MTRQATASALVQIRAALFDLDGTLLDTEGQYTVFMRKIGEAYCPHIPDFAQRVKGTTLAQMFRMYFPTEEMRTAVSQGLNEWEEQMDYRFFPEAREFVSELRRSGVKTAIVTSSDRRKMLNVYQKVEGFRQLFDCVLTSEDFAASKPAPDCYLAASRAVGCQPQECVVFEDSIQGIMAGVNAGIFTFGMTTTNDRATVEGLCHQALDNFHGLTLWRLLEMRNKPANIPIQR